MPLDESLTTDLPALTKQFQDLFRTGVIETFREQNVELTTSAWGAHPSGPHSTSCMGSISFSGNNVVGILVLAAPVEVIRASFPPRLEEPRIEDLADWTGEMANRILGFARRNGFESGLTFDMGVPVVVMGRSFRFPDAHQAQHRAMSFSYKGHNLDVCLDISPRRSGGHAAEAVAPASALIFFVDEGPES